MSLTPEQFNKLATKEDLKNFVTRNEMTGFKDEILTAVDGVAKKLDIIETELTSNQAAHDRFEKRVSRLEAHAGLKPLRV